VKRRRVLQSVLLLAGLIGIAIVTAETFDAADEHVLPSAAALAVAGALCFVTIISSARAWVSLFSDLVTDHANRLILRSTFYLAQLTKYLPAGGVVQTASQVGLAPTAGVPIRRAVVAFPVSVVGAVAACGTLGTGLVFDGDLPGWTRLLALLGLGTVVFLHRGIMAWVLDLAHRLVKRIPDSDHLPTQRDIFSFYGWALVTVGSLCAAYATLLSSLDSHVNPFFVFCAFALSWLVGFLAVPIPAGVGVREAVLVALLPGVGTAPVLAASLALRLLSIAAELVAMVGNRIAMRYRGHQAQEQAAAQPTGDAPVAASELAGAQADLVVGDEEPTAS
jgi:glycosyltransferase 2 family protein